MGTTMRLATRGPRRLRRHRFILELLDPALEAVHERLHDAGDLGQAVTRTDTEAQRKRQPVDPLDELGERRAMLLDPRLRARRWRISVAVYSRSGGWPILLAHSLNTSRAAFGCPPGGRSRTSSPPG